MATLVQSTASMIEQYKQVDGKGRLIDVIEVMNNTSQDIMDDWTWMECNSGTKHTRSIRTGLPSVSWGALYEGIPQSKTAKQTVDDTTGFVEAMSSVDKRQLDLYAENRTAIRASEARPFQESMAQELVSAFFYHNSNTNPRLPKGLGARYGVKSTTGAGAQIVDAGGTGSDNMSIWMVEWGYDGVSAIYPSGTTGGIMRENKGEQRVTDADGNPYYVEEELFRAHVGFTVGDWQRVVRIANIDVSDLAAGSVDLYKFMRAGFYQLKSRRVNKIEDQSAPGRIAVYANRDALEALDGLATNAGASDNYTRLTWGEIQGKEVLTYRGFPIRETDALLNTEARVV
jgi:hypothetical protein